jgi:hypothetical protein
MGRIEKRCHLERTKKVSHSLSSPFFSRLSPVRPNRMDRLAVRASSHQFEHVNVDGVARLRLKCLDHGLEVTALEFLRSPTNRADYLMAVRLQGRRVAVAPFLQMDSLDVPQFHKEVQCAIHGRQPDVRVSRFRLLIYFSRSQAMVCLCDNVEDCLTRARQLVFALAEA